MASSTYTQYILRSIQLVAMLTQITGFPALEKVQECVQKL